MNPTGTVLSLQSLEIPRLEAVVELMFLAAYADESVTSEERAIVHAQVVDSTHGRLGRDTIDAMLIDIEATLAQHGREARFESIRRRLGDAKMRTAALAIAATILRADQLLDPREVAWMARAARALEIPVDEALALLARPG